MGGVGTYPPSVSAHPARGAVSKKTESATHKTPFIKYLLSSIDGGSVTENAYRLQVFYTGSFLEKQEKSAVTLYIFAKERYNE
jgi:hypothetical protein